MEETKVYIDEQCCCTKTCGDGCKCTTIENEKNNTKDKKTLTKKNNMV